MKTQNRTKVVRLLIGIAFVAFSATPALVSAQTSAVRIDSATASRLVQSAQKRLIQPPGPGQRIRQDALADSLVSFILSPAAFDSSPDGRYSAVMALAYASFRELKTPYRGAADRLEIIALNSQERSIVIAAIFGLGNSIDTVGAVRALRKVSTSGITRSYLALQLLGTNFGNLGIAALRELHRDGQVKEPLARETLDGYAFRYGWPKR